MPHVTLGERVSRARARVTALAAPVRARVMRRAASDQPAAGQSVPTPGTARAQPKSAWGTVILPFGRYFAGRADMLTRDRFKTIVPIGGVSPFSGVGDPDPEMLRFAQSERVNDRVKADVLKDLGARLAQSGADYLVVDNSTALMWHRELNGRVYTIVSGEQTDLMDELWNTNPARGRRRSFRVSRKGFTDELKSAYDAFVDTCLESFDPSRIVLIRSHAARFWVSDDGTIGPTDLDRADARLLEQLDDYFVQRTGCRVATAPLAHFPSVVQWQAYDHRLREAMEAELVELCTPNSKPDEGVGEDSIGAGPRHDTAADHVVGAARQNRRVDGDRLRRYFAAGGASYDDLLALAFLEQSDPRRYESLIRDCVQLAVADAKSCPVTETKRRFDRSRRALRGWQWCSPKLLRGDRWIPQIALTCHNTVFRFRSDGSIDRLFTSQVAELDAVAIVDGTLPVTPLNVASVIGSWAMYFERGRRGITAAPRVVVDDAETLVDTSYWLDWSWVLDNERVLIATSGDADKMPSRRPDARTDLSFIFDANARICTVGGGLMDQVTHIALFDELCTPHGLDYYLDDFRYTWWRSHNGFEASRLAPELESKRMTRRVSQALLETFRREVMKTRLPWVFNQSRTWYEFGLREALVVTRDYFNARRLMEIGPEFPVLVYENQGEIRKLMREPPRPLCFFTTQHRIRIAPESADAIRRVFSYHHLEAHGLDPDIAQTAEVLRAAPHVAFHVRRGDYLHPHFDTGGWHAQQHHYIEAVDHLIESEFGTSDFNVAVFSDDMEFVEAHMADYGLERVTGDIRFIRGNTHYNSIFDSYLMSLCPVIVGSVGFFAATTSLLADPPSVFIRAWPEGLRLEWRREA